MTNRSTVNKHSREEGGAAVVVLSVIVGILVVVGLAVGGWQLGWWMKAAATDNNTNIIRHSVGMQQGDIDSARNKIADLNAPGVPAAQRVALVNLVCGQLADVLPSVMPTDLASFQSTECS